MGTGDPKGPAKPCLCHQFAPDGWEHFTLEANQNKAMDLKIFTPNTPSLPTKKHQFNRCFGKVSDKFD